MSSSNPLEPVPLGDSTGSGVEASDCHAEESEWCFPVRCDRGLGEIRVRSNGEVVWTGGEGPVSWVCLDGITFPTEKAQRVEIIREDILRIDNLTALVSPLDEKRHLFHYTKAQTAIEHILRSRMLRFSSYDALNDPWESKDWAFTVVSPRGALRSMQAVEIGREISTLMKQGSRVICFCSDGFPMASGRDIEIFDSNGWGHAAMWAHYAENHHGVVLAFDRRRLLESSMAALSSQGPIFFGSILYVEDKHPAGLYPLVIDQREWASTGSRTTSMAHLDRNRGWLFFTKNLDWAAEQECRLVLHGSQSAFEYLPIERAIVEICIGERTDQATTEALASLGRELGANVTKIVWRNGVAARTTISGMGECL